MAYTIDQSELLVHVYNCFIKRVVYLPFKCAVKNMIWCRITHTICLACLNTIIFIGLIS